MDEEPTSSAGLLKRHRAEEEKARQEVSQPSRIKATWEYLEDLKKLQSLEIEIEEIKLKLKKKESRFPDLKSLRGTVDHLSTDRFFEVEDGDKKRVVAGKNLQDATEKYQKRKELEQKNKEKQKTASAKKKEG